MFYINLEMSACPEYVDHRLPQVRLTVVCVWWYQYGGGQIQTYKLKVKCRCVGLYIMNKLIDILFISKRQFISVKSVDFVSPLNCGCAF
jgi:hypothetical protein